MNKAEERVVLTGFLNARGIPLSFVTEWDRERPDFLATIDGTLVGIEVTLVTEAIPRHQTHPLQWRRETDRVVALAKEEFERTHPEVLIAWLDFRADWQPGAVTPELLAKELAEAVAASLSRPWPWVTEGQPVMLNDAHPALYRVWIDRARHGDSHWEATVAGSVLPATAADIRATVARKEVDLPAYRKAADQQWLLIDCSLTGQHVALEVPDPTDITTRFDRVFCTGFAHWEWAEMRVLPY